MTERNIMQKIPEKLWKNKFVTITIGKDVITEPIQNAEHYLKLKNLRDNKRIFNTGKMIK